MEEVRNLYGGKPAFPAFAYASKGPYLLRGTGFERLSSSGARLLFNGKFSPTAEYEAIRRGIDEVTKSSTKTSATAKDGGNRSKGS